MLQSVSLLAHYNCELMVGEVDYPAGRWQLCRACASAASMAARSVAAAVRGFGVGFESQSPLQPRGETSFK